MIRSLLQCNRRNLKLLADSRPSSTQSNSVQTCVDEQTPGKSHLTIVLSVFCFCPNFRLTAAVPEKNIRQYVSYVLVRIMPLPLFPQYNSLILGGMYPVPFFVFFFAAVFIVTLSALLLSRCCSRFHFVFLHSCYCPKNCLPVILAIFSPFDAFSPLLCKCIYRGTLSSYCQCRRNFFRSLFTFHTHIFFSFFFSSPAITHSPL